MHHLTWLDEAKKEKKQSAPGAGLEKAKDGSVSFLKTQDSQATPREQPVVPFQGAPGKGAEEVSVSWLLTAEDTCALDVKGFAAIEAEVRAAVRGRREGCHFLSA